MINYDITENNGLWLPDDLSDLITFIPGDEPTDENVANCDKVNIAGMNWLDFKISDEEYFDILSDCQIDPQALLQSLDDHFHQIELKIGQMELKI